MAAKHEEQVLCLVTTATRGINGKAPGEEVILSRAAALEQQRRGRVVVLGTLEPTPGRDEEE